MTSNCMHRRHADLLALLVLAATSVWTSPASALESDREQPMDVLADRSEADRATGVLKLSGNVSITQGTLKVEAENGDVHQNSRSGEVERIILRGSPARMQQQLDNAAGEMRASAAQIDYNAGSDTVVLSGNVRIVEPRGTLTGERITYNIAGGNVRAESGSEQVRMVFPGRGAAAADNENGDD